MTERGRSALDRDARQLTIGPSRLAWDGECLVIDIVEMGVPLPRPVRGRVRVYPPALSTEIFDLDRGGHHRWRPIAPRARIEVEMQRPRLSWTGDAYWDSNWGDEPLENRFERWDWSRAMLGDGDTAILYHANLLNEPTRALVLRFDPTGRGQRLPTPPDNTLPPTTIWRIDRAIQSEAGISPSVIDTLEDTPFYARSLVQTGIDGRAVKVMHESLSLARFRQPWVHLLLPFRMPRRPG
jgi:carotenoid 1,2-hydratase